jgi:CheY-like chemotaxis protein
MEPLPFFSVLQTHPSHGSEKEIAMAKTYAPKILVVDDEKAVREITQAFLTLNGYEVNTAENGKEAFDELLHNHYDVVITDMQMPLMGGMELLDKISQMTANIVTILLTGNTVTPSDVSGKPFAHLSKPFSHNQLIHLVQKGLQTNTVAAQR